MSSGRGDSPPPVLRGGMQHWPLVVSNILEYANRWHGEQVSRRPFYHANKAPLRKRQWHVEWNVAIATLLSLSNAAADTASLCIYPEDTAASTV